MRGYKDEVINAIMIVLKTYLSSSGLVSILVNKCYAVMLGFLRPCPKLEFSDRSPDILELIFSVLQTNSYHNDRTNNKCDNGKRQN